MQRHVLMLIFLFIATGGALSGCELQSRMEMAELNNTIGELRVQIESLQKELVQIRGKLTLQEMVSKQYQSAVFDPAASEGFSRLDSSIGRFAVSIKDVGSHADGVKIRLHVGNLTTATVNGGTFKVKWGPRMPDPKEENWVSKYGEWETGLKEKEINFTERLQPGTWNRVTLTLPGIRAEQFGYMELSMDTNEISLIEPR